jgi:CRP/FNR family transcriptional regulator, cyclic AMP receptor protein
MIGTTRSRVSFFLNKFRGLIYYTGKIEVHSSPLNAALCDMPEIERDEEGDREA